VLIDETGLFLNPLVRRTWARRGQTPVFDGWGRHRDKVSVIGAVSVSPAAGRCGFYFATDPDGYFTTAKVVEFLRDLLRHSRGKVAVVWDGGANHKGEAMRAFLARNPRLRVERLPAYAPDLNPVEAVWSWLKYGKLANFVPADVNDLDDWVIEYLVPLKCDPDLLRSIWDGSELPFPSRSLPPADQQGRRSSRRSRPSPSENGCTSRMASITTGRGSSSLRMANRRTPGRRLRQR
jgi:putative transposase